MDIRQARAAFDKEGKIYDSALLTFVGVDGYDVYNCSIPFAMNGREYIFGRVETRREWATSWVRLFEKTGKDTYTLVPDSMIYQLEDPYIQFIGDQLTMGGTHVMKESGEVKSFYGYFYRGTELEHMRYFTTGPDKMKDIRLVSLKDGRIGVFSRPRDKKVEETYGSGAVIGFAVIDSLDDLTADVIENAPSNTHIPAYNRLAVQLFRLGEGSSHGRSVSSAYQLRFQPSTGTTCRSQPMPNSPFTYRANSPMVSAVRLGSS